MSERWHKQREDPLIRTRSSSHQFIYVNRWSVSFQTDTHTLTKMLSGVKVKHILGYNESCILFWNLCSRISSVFKERIVCDYEILTEEAQEGKCSQDSLLQQILYINMSYSHTMWCYYRQYIALWGMVWLLINVFDHVSHYCHHMWSSTWVMRLSFYVGIKERSIHCAP